MKRHFCLSFFLSYLFICSGRFVIIETQACDTAHDEYAMSSFIIQSIY